MKELSAMKLPSPRLEVPFSKLSFSTLCKKVRTMKSPAWMEYTSPGSYGRPQHTCDLNTTIDRIVDEVVSAVKGLKLQMTKESKVSCFQTTRSQEYG
jgi:hypothetical protein